MKALLCFVQYPLLLLLAALWPCSRKECFIDAVENQLFGGKKIGKKEYFSFAAIRLIRTSSYVCGGVVVGSRHVLSARHCFKDAVKEYEVQVGYLCNRTANCGRRTMLIGIEDIFPHPEGDMALLVLDDPIPFKKIKPAVPYLGKDVQPDQPALRKGTAMLLVSAGMEIPGGDPSPFVKKLKVKSISTNKCRKKISNQDIIRDTTLCSMTKDGDPCKGDSGSPLFVRGKGELEGRDIVVAIHNWGPEACDEPKVQKKPVGHFRLSDAAGWLQRRICEGETPEDWCPVADAGDGDGDGDGDVDGPSNQSPGGSDDVDGSSNFLGVMGTPVSATMIQKVSFGMTAFSASFDPTDAIRVASGGTELRILDRTQLDEEDGGLVYQFPGVSSVILQTAYSRDGALIATGGGGNFNVQIWNAVNFNGQGALYELGPHTDNILSLVWSHDNKSLFVAGEDFVVSHWEVATETKIGTFRGHSGGIFGIGLHADGTQLVTGSSDATIKIWDVNTATEIRSWNGGHLGPVRAVAFSPDGTKVVSGGNSDVKIWDISGDQDQPPTTFTFSRFLGGHTNSVRSVLFTPDGKYAVSASHDRTIKFWDIENGGRPVLELDYFEMFGVTQLEWIAQQKANTLFLAAFAESNKASFVWEISLTS